MTCKEFRIISGQTSFASFRVSGGARNMVTLSSGTGRDDSTILQQ